MSSSATDIMSSSATDIMSSSATDIMSSSAIESNDHVIRLRTHERIWVATCQSNCRDHGENVQFRFHFDFLNVFDGDTALSQ